MDMAFTFTVYHQTRENFFELVNSLSEDQLNRIPAGLKNNVIWNFGHVIVTQQLLTYGICGLPKICDDDFIEQFKKGSSPLLRYDKDGIFKILSQTKNTLNTLESDYEEGKFKYFKPYTTSFGIHLNSIEEVIQFLPLHEALHLGYAMAIRKAL